MNTTLIADENNQAMQENPGSQLARIREKKGFTIEYVAGKLHLRVRMIELLEADEYHQLPEPVFVKGYLRAYAKLLGVAPEPYLAVFNTKYSHERKLEKALWQSKRESNKGERIVRLITALVAVIAIAAVSFWWQKNKEVQQPQAVAVDNIETVVPAEEKKSEEVQLNALSKMQSMFSSTDNDEKAPAEAEGE